MAISLPIIYVIFSLTVFCKHRKFFGLLGPTTIKATYSQMMVSFSGWLKIKFHLTFFVFQVFLQVAIIAVTNFLIAFIFLAIQFGLVPGYNWLATTHLFLYIQAHG